MQLIFKSEKIKYDVVIQTCAQNSICKEYKIFILYNDIFVFKKSKDSIEKSTNLLHITLAYKFKLNEN